MHPYSVILDYDTNARNATNIDSYIEAHSDCKIPKNITLNIQGQSKDLQTYHLPLDLTFYNIKNGRFAAEYADLKKEKGRDLDATNLEDSRDIKNLLIGIEPNQSQILQDSILRDGQQEPGIITYDGYVINGNRRRAVLDNLVLDGHSNYRFIDVARLPQNVSAKDLWKIEAGIQLSRNKQLNYGPINELLKFKEGIDAGLSAKEIARELYGGFKENDILVKLEEFKLIAEYLQFIQEPNVFNKAKGIHEHFIDLRKILAEFKKRANPAPDEIVRAKHIGFQLIHDGVPAREFRKMKDVLLNDSSKENLWSAEKYSKPELLSIKDEKKIKADQQDGLTEARIIFNNCLDKVKADSEAQKPETLLRRALTNLESIDITHCNLNNPTIKQLIEQIQNVLHNIHSVKPDIIHRS